MSDDLRRISERHALAYIELLDAGEAQRARARTREADVRAGAARRIERRTHSDFLNRKRDQRAARRQSAPNRQE